MSTACKSSHSGFLDVSCSSGGLGISGWIGQLSCLTIFSTSLSVAAFLCRAGGSMLESTGSHGRGIERRVPEMRRMVEFNCPSLVTLCSNKSGRCAVFRLDPFCGCTYNVILPSYHSKCCNFSLRDFLTTYDKVYMPRPGWFLGMTNKKQLKATS